MIPGFAIRNFQDVLEEIEVSACPSIGTVCIPEYVFT